MIHQIKGDVLNISEGIIVHGCNCAGVMGSGIALEVKNRYPEAYTAYKTREKLVGLQLGEISIARVDTYHKYIVNALTQAGYGRTGRDVNYEAVAQCFEKVSFFATQLYLNEKKDLPVVFPKIGAGLGGGDWDIISTIIDKTVPDTIRKVLYIL